MINPTKIFLYLCLFSLFYLQNNVSFSQSKEMIEGIWYNEEKTAKIEVYLAKNRRYYGQIMWLKTPIDPETNKPKTDKFNPDETKRNEPTLGLKILKNFHYSKAGIWEGGTIYDPKNGKTYSCEIKMESDNPNKLFVRGYVLSPLFGRTTTWERTTLDE